MFAPRRRPWFAALLAGASLSTTLFTSEASAEPAPAPSAAAGAASGDEQPPAPLVRLGVEAPAAGPWVMRVTNDGATSVRVVADARLLWLEVVPSPEAPAKPPAARRMQGVAHVRGKMATCKAPPALRGVGEENDRSLILRPGEAYVEEFDPMLLCGAGKLMAGLRQGALVYPSLGYPDPPRHGPKPKKAPAPKPPFVVESLREPRDVAPMRHLEATPFVVQAAPIEATDEASRAAAPPHAKGDEAAREGEPRDATRPEATGGAGKHASGKSDGAAGAKPPGDDADAPRPEAGATRDDKPPVVLDERAARLEVTSTRRADAHAARDVALDVQIENKGKRAALVHMRGDDVSFDVTTPQGQHVVCDAGLDRRGAARDFFEPLAPGAKRKFGALLRERCPAGTFSRPGIYQARAVLTLRDEGHQYRLAAMVTRVEARELAKFRLQTAPLRYHVAPPAASKGQAADARNDDGLD